MVGQTDLLQIFNVAGVHTLPLLMGQTKVTSSKPDNGTLEDVAHLYLVCTVMESERFSARIVCLLLSID